MCLQNTRAIGLVGTVVLKLLWSGLPIKLKNLWLHPPIIFCGDAIELKRSFFSQMYLSITVNFSLNLKFDLKTVLNAEISGDQSRLRWKKKHFIEMESTVLSSSFACVTSAISCSFCRPLMVSNLDPTWTNGRCFHNYQSAWVWADLFPTERDFSLMHL